jgi:hypothetical protein
MKSEFLSIVNAGSKIEVVHNREGNERLITARGCEERPAPFMQESPAWGPMCAAHMARE